MNLKNMGYAMKGTEAATCSQCHKSKNMPSYTSLHNKHVANEEYDCSWCHTFSRPEKALTMAPGPEITPPVVTGFGLSSASNALTVAISTFTAIDDVSVTGYLVNESPTKPLATASGWSPTKPATYVFASAGAKTLYAWAKDAAGNVSEPLSRTTTILNTSLYANFDGFGLFEWDGSAWTRIRTELPSSMVASGTDLYANFANGLYQWDGSAWKRINRNLASSMVASF